MQCLLHHQNFSWWQRGANAYSFFTGSWYLEGRWGQLTILCVTVKTAVPSGLSSGFFPASLQESTCASVSMWLFRPTSILSCQLALLKRMDVLGNKSVNAKEVGLIIKVILYCWAIWSPINNKAKEHAEKSSFSAILVQKYKKNLLYFLSPFNTILSFLFGCLDTLGLCGASASTKLCGAHPGDDREVSAAQSRSGDRKFKAVRGELYTETGSPAYTERVRSSRKKVWENNE